MAAPIGDRLPWSPGGQLLGYALLHQDYARADQVLAMTHCTRRGRVEVGSQSDRAPWVGHVVPSHDGGAAQPPAPEQMGGPSMIGEPARISDVLGASDAGAAVVDDDDGIEYCTLGDFKFVRPVGTGPTPDVPHSGREQVHGRLLRATTPPNPRWRIELGELDMSGPVDPNHNQIQLASSDTTGDAPVKAITASAC